MLQKIEARAELSVARGCGFAGLGMLTLMVGLSGDPAAALKAGGISALFACTVLLAKARNASRRPYKTTELWIMLKPDERPKSEIAQQVIGNVLREVYFRFAQHAAALSALMLAMAVIIMLAGIMAKPW